MGRPATFRRHRQAGRLSLSKPSGRLGAVGAALLLVTSACASATESAPEAASGAGPTTSTAETAEPDSRAPSDAPVPCSANPVRSSDREDTDSGLAWIGGTSFGDAMPEPTLARNKVVPVLRADGIPAIDVPLCVPVGQVTDLGPDAPVVALELGGEARAYPLEILTWHELVNDTVGGVPVTVSYCPLCNSAIAYDRRVGERVLDFGTSGALTQSSMVMYDRQTESLWSHFNGTSFAGVLTGAELAFFSTSVLSFATFTEEYPDGTVLSRDTGFSRDYGINPYPGYEAGQDPFAQFITDEIDPRLNAKERVVGIELAGEAVAVRHKQVFTDGVAAVELADTALSVWNRPGTASALDAAEIDDGVDVGTVGVFNAEVEGQVLSFVRDGDVFVDNETGSTWTIVGRSIDGPLVGTRLEPVTHLDTFWFAWATFYPDTAILG